MIEKDYAKALLELNNRTSDVRLLKNLRGALARRGHQKLLPRIFAEYQKLLLAQKRSSMHREVTPERERSRVLLELYRKLIASS